MKLEEFRAGLRPDGNIIGTYKSDRYKRKKQAMNPLAGGTVDLILSGDFSKKLFLENTKPSLFKFDSTDEKATDLFKKYGEDLKGLNPKSFRDVEILFLKDKYIKGIRQLIGI